MARDTLANAHAELYGLISATPITGIAAMYDYDPGDSRRQGPIALMVLTVVIDPDFWTFVVRLVIDIGANPKAMQESLDTIIPTITERVTAAFGPERWVIGPDPNRPDIYLAEWAVECGREDLD